ncbi:hypothetical protein RF11_00293 [Thelohanellus kitauei]|uniref:Uncharacterized protein n=1 Tax=Thelohanellus kitauei TaxID=669202 RepID=A0A0C2MF61_THEKT|nr:hypothetical protein RF11_00293 [Thelohanellus kitauei]
MITNTLPIILAFLSGHNCGGVATDFSEENQFKATNESLRVLKKEWGKLPEFSMERINGSNIDSDGKEDRVIEYSVSIRGRNKTHTEPADEVDEHGSGQLLHQENEFIVIEDDEDDNFFVGKAHESTSNDTLVDNNVVSDSIHSPVRTMSNGNQTSENNSSLKREHEDDAGVFYHCFGFIFEYYSSFKEHPFHWALIIILFTISSTFKHVIDWAMKKYDTRYVYKSIQDNSKRGLNTTGRHLKS